MKPVTLRPLDRYREVIPDWAEFVDAISRPLPWDGHVNTLRATPDGIARRLEASGISITFAEWNPSLFRASHPIGATLEHWLGHYYVQEAAQSAPVLALDPRPGERVLDLCAAPGGKSVHIAGRMKNTGLLVVNEPNGRRQQALLANLNRAGVWNAAATEYRGQDMPFGESFDRVLVDAPCSAEGTLRKASALRDGASRQTIDRLSRLQVRLILRAFDLVHVGGTLVYSTCTFAPEENEAIVATLLSQRSALVVSPSFAFPCSPGLDAWEGSSFPASIRDCVRIYPHHLNSGGGFVALIRRLA